MGKSTINGNFQLFWHNQRVCHFRFHVIEKPVGVEDSKPQRFPWSYFWAPPEQKGHTCHISTVCSLFLVYGYGPRVCTAQNWIGQESSTCYNIYKCIHMREYIERGRQRAIVRRLCKNLWAIPKKRPKSSKPGTVLSICLPYPSSSQIWDVQLTHLIVGGYSNGEKS